MDIENVLFARATHCRGEFIPE